MATGIEKLKGIWDNSKEEDRQEELRKNPLDKVIPLDIRVNGRIALKPMLPESLRSEFPDGNHDVVSFATFEQNGIKCYRVDLVTEDKQHASYLWIMEDSVGVEVRWFRRSMNVIPADQVEWEFWLAENDGSIGLSQFEDIDPDRSVYDRVWDPENPNRIAPFEFDTREYPDKYDPLLSFRASYKAMLYGRDVGTAENPCTLYCHIAHLSVPAGDDREAVEMIILDKGVDLPKHTGVSVIY